MPDLATLKLWLAEAEVGKHKLLLGEKRVTVSYEGKSVTFNDRSQLGAMDQLNAYIADLKGRIAVLEGSVAEKTAPIHLTF